MNYEPTVLIGILLIGVGTLAIAKDAWKASQRAQERNPDPANPAIQCFAAASAYVSEHVTEASVELIKAVSHCDGDCIVTMVVNESLAYRSNIPRERGIEILEIAASAMHQAND